MILIGFNAYFLISKYLYVVPFGLLLIDFLLGLFLMAFVRVIKRFYIEVMKNTRQGKKTVIFGAGATGERVVREIFKTSGSDYYPVVFVDDSPEKIGSKVHNIKIECSIKNFKEYAKDQNIQAALIAMPSASRKTLRLIFDDLKELGVKEIKIVPKISDLSDSINIIKSIHDIHIEDLLSRDPIVVESQDIKSFLTGKNVLITGAAGSIGSEIVKQVVGFLPKKIIAYEIDETELHDLTLELNKKLKGKNICFEPWVGDVRDAGKLEKVFLKYDIDVVFHAAAYKHVPLMEFFPEEAVKTNILGTHQLASMASKHEVKCMVNISTDKAVNPSSIMGATKRMAELICSSFNGGKTKFISVRFGNVLGSRGSVIPIFLNQIKEGGPVTVTDPEMKRYFMTIPEAVLLTIQAASMGDGGEVFVLDMGEPVKIVKLAEDLIKINNLIPYEDIGIVFSGLRPGEKLFEELLTAEEGTDATQHDKIFKAIISNKLSEDKVSEIINKFKNSLCEDKTVIKNLIEENIPFYKN
jgi:FlaA1/EpsC-like NDP-sugar epimerase